MKDLPRRAVTGILYGVAVLLALLAPPEIFVLLVIAMVVLSLYELASLRAAGAPAALLLGLVLIGSASLVLLRSASEPIFGPARVPSDLLMTFLAVWSADVGAYAVGSAFGRRKIAPRISPGKTWEGTVAGIVAAAIVVILWNRPFLAFPAWAIPVAILIGPAAFAGDLLESWVKRRAGVKDSGRLLPGHGGVLDRIDSLMAATPVVVISLVIAGRLG